jgi:hypothetical protein
MPAVRRDSSAPPAARLAGPEPARARWSRLARRPPGVPGGEPNPSAGAGRRCSGGPGRCCRALPRHPGRPGPARWCRTAAGRRTRGASSCAVARSCRWWSASAAPSAGGGCRCRGKGGTSRSTGDCHAPTGATVAQDPEPRPEIVTSSRSHSGKHEPDSHTAGSGTRVARTGRSGRKGQRRSSAGVAVTCWVGWWACQDSNLGPHPYQVSRAKRCADRRFPR